MRTWRCQTSTVYTQPAPSSAQLPESSRPPPAPHLIAGECKDNVKYPTPTFTQNRSLAKATVTPRPLASLLCTRYCCRVLLCTTTSPLSSFYTQGHHSFGGSDSQDQDLTGHGARTQLAKLQSRVGSAPSLHYTRGPSPGNSPDVSPNRQTSHMPVCRRPARRR